MHSRLPHGLRGWGEPVGNHPHLDGIEAARSQAATALVIATGVRSFTGGTTIDPILAAPERVSG